MIFIGVDIGTGSSKAVAVDEGGNVLAQARRDHETSSPRPGRFEHDADQTWLQTPAALVRELVEQLRAQSRSLNDVGGLAFSGIGPAVVPTDATGRPLRPAILYGIDTRAMAQVEAGTEHFGESAILAHCGNLLSSQAIGPKLSWIAAEEPELWARTRMLHTAASFSLFHLTGEYVWDRYTASAADPLYDLSTNNWWPEAWDHYGKGIDLAQPGVAPSSAIVGRLHAHGAELTGLPVGTPVLAGTIDAMAEAYSVGVEHPGDTMLMYGSTLFMIQVSAQFAEAEPLWAVGGFQSDDHGLAAGMSTGGLAVTWAAKQLAMSVPELMMAAAQSEPGSHGLILLPYLSGERTPFSDPDARGVWLGLSLRHEPADLARSVLEAVGYGIRHNLEKMVGLGASPKRLVAVGGGTQSEIWLQTVSDICGMSQTVPPITVGASYGDARMVAHTLGFDTTAWNQPAKVIEPRDVGIYDEFFTHYVNAYVPLRETMHALARHND